MSSKSFVVAMPILLLLSLGDDLRSQQATPDTENGRFTLSAIAEGFLRLDTRTGAVSTCTNKGGWVCRVVPDERVALDAEMGRLLAENRKLQTQLAQREGPVTGKIDTPLAKEDREKSAEISPGRKLEFELPAEHEKLMALIDRVWDRLLEMAARAQKRLSEKL